MSDDKLLAKSGHNPPTLAEHTEHVLAAAEALFGTAAIPTRLGECWLRFFKLTDVPRQPFYASLTAACGLHDWGKANSGFQNAVRWRGEQAIRHEHFSALLTAQPVVWDWLQGCDGLDREVVLSAVLTHHLKARIDQGGLYGFAVALTGYTRPAFDSLAHTERFRPVAAATADRLRLTTPDLQRVQGRWVFDGYVRAEQRRVNGLLNTLRRDLDDNASRRRLLHAVRAGLIAADAAGSGLRRTGQDDIAGWVAGTFAEAGLWDGKSVRDKVITPRVTEIEQTKGVEFRWTDFQEHCADPTRVPARALLLAPCGSGKTLAAWRWIERQAERRVGHVLFLYPTRATATEGFKDYISWAPEAEARLMHGTSEFDLTGMFDNPADDRSGKRFVSEADQRLFAVGLWGRRAFSATVDQFLAFLQFGRGPMCMLPVLADSVVVIDEVHSFDNKMFDALKGFLRHFDVPVLCMTATLPPTRRAMLVAPVEQGGCGLTAYPEGEMPPELLEVARRPRYRLRRSSKAAATTAVVDALKAGKRVLWVVNQVKRAHAVTAAFVTEWPLGPDAAELRTADGVPVICYHSRFKLVDRVDRHRDTMAALRSTTGAGPALGVTTQVCEMSLDIDVDLLVTEDCPVTALVQRMGRCNRAQQPRRVGDAADPGAAGTVLVYPPDDDDHAPYAGADGKKNQLIGFNEFVGRFGDGDKSQDDIDKVFQDPSFPSPKLPGEGVCMFLDSGPYAVGGEEEFRETEEFNRPCVLAGDVDEYHAAKPDAKPGFVLPVPRRWAKLRDNDDPRHAKLPGHLGVADEAHYHPLTGFRDPPKECV